MEYKLLIVKNRYNKKLNLKTGLDWFEEHTPLKIVVDEIETDFTPNFVPIGNGKWSGGIPGNLHTELSKLVEKNKYHAVAVFAGKSDTNNLARVSICYDMPLFPGTELIYVCKESDKGKTLNHELFHAFFNALKRKGIYLNDPMDGEYLNNDTLSVDKPSNRTMSLELLKPYWERVVKPNTIVQNIIATVTPMKKYKYFSDSEIIGLKPELVSMLDKAREVAGVPFKINSGFRTPEQNEKAGGVKDSAHMSGLAVDISCTNDVNRWAIINSLISVGFTRIGVAKTFIHADCDKSKTQKVIWMY